MCGTRSGSDGDEPDFMSPLHRHARGVWSEPRKVQRQSRLPHTPDYCYLTVKLLMSSTVPWARRARAPLKYGEGEKPGRKLQVLGQAVAGTALRGPGRWAPRLTCPQFLSSRSAHESRDGGKPARPAMAAVFLPRERGAVCTARNVYKGASAPRTRETSHEPQKAPGSISSNVQRRKFKCIGERGPRFPDLRVRAGDGVPRVECQHCQPTLSPASQPRSPLAASLATASALPASHCHAHVHSLASSACASPGPHFLGGQRAGAAQAVPASPPSLLDPHPGPKGRQPGGRDALLTVSALWFSVQWV